MRASSQPIRNQRHKPLFLIKKTKRKELRLIASDPRGFRKKPHRSRNENLELSFLIVVKLESTSFRLTPLGEHNSTVGEVVILNIQYLQKALLMNFAFSIFFSGLIHHSEIYKVMCSMSPPVGFGKKCPRIVGYKVCNYSK